jgi:hypothetical protein
LAYQLTHSEETPRRIYVSYAWGDDLTPEGREREVLVDRLCEAARERGLTILRDRTALRTGDSIDAFMRRIGEGDRIFVFLSEKYLRSPFCMFELSEIWRNSRQEGQSFLDRVKLYPLPDAKYRTPDDWISWAAFWKKEHDRLAQMVRDHVDLGVRPVFERMERTQKFYNQVTEILALLADRVSARDFEAFERYGFDEPAPPPPAAVPPKGTAGPGPVVAPHPQPARPSAEAPHAPWASTFGSDDHGHFAGLVVDGVTQFLRWIPPGTFMMGSPEDEPGRFDDEGPRHKITLSAGFWLFESPCTQALWQAVMGGNPSRFEGADRPVERVSWNECQAFVARINARVPGLGLSLPTEAQWEYACRAEVKTAIYTGHMPIVDRGKAPALDPIAWYGHNSVGETHPVGQKAANSWGLYDMLGNVWEWCQDGKRAYAAGSFTDPVGATDGASRVIRGGSWYDAPKSCRSACRRQHGSGSRSTSLGFRCARVQG